MNIDDDISENWFYSEQLDFEPVDPDELSYLYVPLVDGDYDLDSFTEKQLADFYWDNPESIPDGLFDSLPDGFL